MFLLKRATTVVLLVTLFGILLPDLYIQPAQALECYECTQCSTTNMNKQKCPRNQPFCADTQLDYPDGTIHYVRGCATTAFAASHSYASCEELRPYHDDPNVKIKVCLCQTDLCNGNLGKKTEKKENDASTRTRILTQLLLFSILVSVSASWINL